MGTRRHGKDLMSTGSSRRDHRQRGADFNAGLRWDIRENTTGITKFITLYPDLK
jgi:hypothetical protein